MDADVKVSFTAAAVARFHRKHGGHLIVGPHVHDGTSGGVRGALEVAQLGAEIDRG